jgi:predicted RNase H-like HicB family nuclease
MDRFTTIIQADGDGFVALCPELDIASQGATAAESLRNLQQAVALFLEYASPAEVDQRLSRK